MGISSWVWCGVPGHFCAADSCRFHLHTRVGDYRVSTVGDYRPGGGKAKEIGCGRMYETFVFRVEGEGECGAGEVVGWGEIDSEGYNDFREAERGHMKMCKRYDRIAKKEKV